MNINICIRQMKFQKLLLVCILWLQTINTCNNLAQLIANYTSCFTLGGNGVS